MVFMLIYSSKVVLALQYLDNSNFEVNINVFPEKDYYAPGDTITTEYIITPKDDEDRELIGGEKDNPRTYTFETDLENPRWTVCINYYLGSMREDFTGSKIKVDVKYFYLDEERKGVRSIVVNVTGKVSGCSYSGTCNYKLISANCEDCSDDALPSANIQVAGTATPLTTTTSKATLYVYSSPSGAEVYINGDYRGKTPLTIDYFDPGTYDVRISKKGYHDYTTTVTLFDGDSKTVSATLTPIVTASAIDTDSDGIPDSIKITYYTGSKSPYLKNLTYSVDYSYLKPLCGKEGPSCSSETYVIERVDSGVHRVLVNAEFTDGTSQLVLDVSITTSQTLSAVTKITTTFASTVTTTHLATTTPRWYMPTTTTISQVSETSSYLLGLSLIVLLAIILLSALVYKKSKNKTRKESQISELQTKSFDEPSGKEILTPTLPEPKPQKPRIEPVSVLDFPSSLLSKYAPLELIGEGGFAKVFKVKRKSDGQIIALKVPNLDEKSRKFFLKEVKAWTLLDHPNIVKLYNAFDEPVPHLEIEFVEGVKLNGVIIRDIGQYPKPVEEEKALHFVRGTAEGLKHAHSKQVYHRDLKPQNVLIKSDLTPKITDWGLAKVGAISTTATTTKGLTLLYAAPEQLDEETYGNTDARTDIYQLGLVFYELLTGNPPYSGGSIATVMAKVINPEIRPKPPSYYNKALAKYDGIFEKLLAKRKEGRYQSVDEFLEDLDLLIKLEEERRALEEEIEKTKTTMSITTDSKELEKLRRLLVEQLSRNALLLAQLNDKTGLINMLEDLKAFTKEHRKEIESAVGQIGIMIRESIPISKSTLEELRVLLHRVQREVAG